MDSITLHSHVNPDGTLHLHLLDELRDQDVTVTIQPSPINWLSVLEQTAGSIPDLVRHPQGDYETREPL